MKLTHFLAAATMIAGLGVSTAASAQDYRHDDRRDVRYEQQDRRGYDDRGDRRDYRGDDRRDYRGYRHGDGNRYGWNRHQRRCHTEYRHHRRVTVCYR